MQQPDYLKIVIEIIGSLSLLLYGMKIMSESLQKMAGSQLRRILGAMTTNRFTGILTGTFITCAVQSSSATTVMTVSFVNAGLLSLAQAISVIMGANIGTTLTAWIMSLGFSVDLRSVVFPAFFIGIMLIFVRKKSSIGDFLFGLAFMFFSLVLLSTCGKDLQLDKNPEMIEFFKSFDIHSYSTILIFLAVGTIITGIVQSSAAVMAITILMCSTGVLPIYLGIALVMGENIGTTMTANLAALGATPQARRAALAHLVFNVTGVIWVIIFFYPFTHFCCQIVGYEYESTTNVSAQRVSMALAAFHTAFNLCNTFLLVWFIPVIERIVNFIIKSEKEEEEVEPRLQFLEGGIMQTPELSVLEAQKEIHQFGLRTHRMFDMAKEIINTEKNDETFIKQFSRLEKYESIADKMELEISKYLEQVSDNHLSDITKAQIRRMLRIISEIESISDSCYNIARIINRKVSSQQEFSAEQYKHIHRMTSLIDQSLQFMDTLLSSHHEQLDVNPAFNLENEINNYRNQLKTQNIYSVDSHEYSYSVGTIYMDIINECEKLNDYIVNVVEASTGIKKKEA
ncbi:MAG: Na/Pi cotransporter family protein [Prevotellaceae bacterium]|nr:Na/Pi cotransporter family protein [Prevotellaceae bacterium]